MKTTFLIVCTLFLVNTSFSQIDELRKGQEARKKYIDRTGNKGVPSNKQLTDYVNPFIGTGGHGHTFPGATLPFGMMQLSPDTRFDGWDGCSGYHYSDSIIYGFSHTHLSGTGVSDYGDLLIVPQNGKPRLDPGYSSKKGYQAKFSHINEKASPGYYEVSLDDPKIDVRLTVAERSGMHEYTFKNKKGKKFILIDLDHRDELLSSSFNIVDNQTISGSRISKSWAEEQHFYFYLEIDAPYQKARRIEKNGKHKLLLIFPKSTKKIKLRVGMSAVDIEGAKGNLAQEITDWDFEKLHTMALNKWNLELSKIKSSTSSNEIMTNFYTALYHSFIAPNIFNDVNGMYRGHDGKIHQLNPAKENQYTVFSLWDTYRATHPLYTLTQVEKTNDFINTFLRMYDQSGDLPVWELAGNETECMIGYHSVSVIADAYTKGIRGYDTYKALKAMKATSHFDEYGKIGFHHDGVINSSQEPESVSKNLEYAYDEFCINEMEQAMNNGLKENILPIARRKEEFNFVNSFDPSSLFMRARKYGMWHSPFEPSEVNFNYTEANSWQYSLYAPHAIGVLRKLIGGHDALESWLDRLFTTESQLEGRHQVDITGLIGQYAHGNEPSHHMAYLYNYTNAPEKTAFYVDKILSEMYQNAPDGLSGNEDCGQMSSWYVLSAMGLYQVAPGNPYYDFGRPLMDEVIIEINDNKSFIIKTFNNSIENKYIQSILLNGEEIEQTFIAHRDIIAGGELNFYMGNQPSTNYSNFEASPTINEYDSSFVPLPFFRNTESIFLDSIIIDISSVDTNFRPIYYSLTGSGETANWILFENPFTLHTESVIHAYAESEIAKSSIVSQKFTQLDQSMKLSLQSTFSKEYSAGGESALIDGIFGTTEYRTGGWQGYLDQDIIAKVAFTLPREINTVSIGFLEDIKSWIFYPSEIYLEVSFDGVNYEKVQVISTTETPKHERKANYTIFSFNIEQKNRVVALRIKATNFGKCPEWHLGAGGSTWLFSDEILIK